MRELPALKELRLVINNQQVVRIRRLKRLLESLNFSLKEGVVMTEDTEVEYLKRRIKDQSREIKKLKKRLAECGKSRWG